MRSLCLALLLIAAVAHAGPPFVTDDPEPVDYHHWEVYAATLGTRDDAGLHGTLPHVEVNYGAAPGLQLHVILPLAYAGDAHGLGDTELGAKYRLLDETPHRPQLGVFQLLEVPTGSASRGLGGGHLQAFFPLWAQKSWGPWMAYGGGGYWVNPSDDNRNYWLTGVVVQRDLSAHLTLGGELYATTPAAVDAGSELNINLGGQYNFNEGHHLLFSIGRGLHGETTLLYYLAYQWTLGPADEGGQAVH